MQYLKQADGSIVEFDPVFVANDEGKKIQVISVAGEEVPKAAYDKQEAKREKAAQAAQASQAKDFEAKQAARKSAIEKLAKAAGLTAEEVAALLA